MCGIAGIAVLDGKEHGPELTTLAAELLRGIDHRGGDATGYACFGAGRVHMQKASCRVPSFLKEWRGVPAGSRTVLLHTRYATQGLPAFPENNHPIAHGPVYVVHNGHIRNDSDLFTATGRERIGSVDSEAIPAVLMDSGWEQASAGLERLQGAYAIAAVNTKHPGELILARGGYSPLVVFSNGRMLVWASEGFVIADAWKAVYGSEPAADRLVPLKEGTMLRLQGSHVTRSSFVVADEPVQSWKWEPSSYVPAWSARGDWQPAKTKSEPAKSEPAKSTKSEREPTKLGTALRSLALVRGRAEDEDDEVRCGCCDDWTDPFSTEEWYGERVCLSCARELRYDDSDLAIR